MIAEADGPVPRLAENGPPTTKGGSLAKLGGLTIPADYIEAVIAARVDEVLTDAYLDAVAERRIDARIGMLPLETAAPRLGCRNVRQLVDFCREHRIPIEHFGRKKRFVKIAEIEAAQKRNAVKSAGAGTVIAFGKAEMGKAETLKSMRRTA